MTVSAPAVQPELEEPRVLVARQPVIDRQDRIVGYRVSYALNGDGGPYAPGPEDAIAALDEALGVIGAEEYAVGVRAHLPVSREMLLHLRQAPPVDPARVVLRVRYVDTLDKSVVGVIAAARQRGFELELDDLTRADFDPFVLRLFGAVEFNLDALGFEQVAALMPGLRLRGTLGVAAGVGSHADRDRARTLGCDWFAGPFYMRPSSVAGKPIPVGNMRTLFDLLRMFTDDLNLDELVGVIERDVGLSVSLLRYINSAYFGLASRIRSIRHAAAMLGTRGLARWALVAASVAGAEQIPREQVLLALTRARMCELLAGPEHRPAGPDVLFTIGLLSATDVIFGASLESIAAELGLAEVVVSALLEHEGPAGETLGEVLAFEEQGLADLEGRAAPGGRHQFATQAAAYRSALAWARDALTNGR